MGYACGYNIYDENHAKLLSTAQSASQFTFGNIDPRTIQPLHMENVLHVEDQMTLSSCEGNSLTTVIETCLWHQSEHSVNVQLSRMFAYIESQKKCGISGDSGATLEGGLAAGKDVGFCLESLAPYTGQYFTQFSKECYDDAQSRKLLSHAPIRQLQEAYEGLARRVGAIFLGIPCTDEIFNADSGGRLEHYTPQRCGGHALAIVDVCDDKDENGYPYLLLANSWGTKYGWRGYRKIKPSAFVSMLNCQLTSCYLISEMQFLKPRYDWNSKLWAA